MPYNAVKLGKKPALPGLLYRGALMQLTNKKNRTQEKFCFDQKSTSFFGVCELLLVALKQSFKLLFQHKKSSKTKTKSVIFDSVPNYNQSYSDHLCLSLLIKIT